VEFVGDGVLLEENGIKITDESGVDGGGKFTPSERPKTQVTEIEKEVKEFEREVKKKEEVSPLTRLS